MKEQKKCNVENCNRVIGEEAMCIVHITEQLNHERIRILAKVDEMINNAVKYDSDGFSDMKLGIFIEVKDLKKKLREVK